MRSSGIRTDAELFGPVSAVEAISDAGKAMREAIAAVVGQVLNRRYGALDNVSFVDRRVTLFRLTPAEFQRAQVPVRQMLGTFGIGDVQFVLGDD
jgi:hypothetical protein